MCVDCTEFEIKVEQSKKTSLWKAIGYYRITRASGIRWSELHKTKQAAYDDVYEQLYEVLYDWHTVCHVYDQMAIDAFFKGNSGSFTIAQQICLNL